MKTVRTSTGIRPFEYAGHFFSRVSSDIELACINAGNSVAVELKYDDKLSEDEFAVIQVAVLYTAVSGERRVRCHNLALSVCTTVADVFRSACCDSLMNLMVRQSVSSLREGTLTVQQTKENMITKAVKILTSYRRHCAQPGSSLGQLILPEALKLLPMYVTGAIKCDAIDGGPEMLPDDKAFAQIRTLGASIRSSQVMLYPKLLKIEYDTENHGNLVNGSNGNEATSDTDDLLSSNNLRVVFTRCSEIRLDPSAVCFILENAFYLFIYIPVTQNSRQEQFVKNVFGAGSLQAIHPDAVSILY